MSASAGKITGEITGQISWVYCRDLAETVPFYRDVLGLEVARDAISAMIFAAGPGAMIGVCEAFGDRVIEPAGGMITLLVEDVDGWYARLKSRRAALKGPPERIERFGIYSFFCTDPNGYVIEVQTFLT